jgi:hypothetical protein
MHDRGAAIGSPLFIPGNEFGYGYPWIDELRKGPMLAWKIRSMAGRIMEGRS